MKRLAVLTALTLTLSGQCFAAVIDATDVLQFSARFVDSANALSYEKMSMVILKAVLATEDLPNGTTQLAIPNAVYNRVFSPSEGSIYRDLGVMLGVQHANRAYYNSPYYDVIIDNATALIPQAATRSIIVRKLKALQGRRIPNMVP